MTHNERSPGSMPAIPRFAGMKKRIPSLFLFTLLPVILLSLVPAYSQEEKDADWYYSESQIAIMDEHYEYATRILNEAKEKFPLDSQFPLQLGDLYYNKDFYELALKEYLLSDSLDPKDYYTLDRIQDCYGYLNQEHKAIEYLEQIIDEYPPDEFISSVDTIDDLGWMYFKTHQLEKGEELILDALSARSASDVNRDLAMTLGTLYSGMYDYERSKEFYLKSIEEAEEDMDYYFASVAYYNLSLLEHTFYNFNSALQYTNDSIASQDRATGHLSKGELYQTQMNFPEALAQYEEGESRDNTPLTKINIAILLQIFGRLDEALVYARNVYTMKDQSWMHNFGTDMKRHKKELFEILADIYEGMANQENTLPRGTAAGKTASLFSYLWNSFHSYYYRQKYKSYSLIVGEDYLKEQEYLDAYWEFYKANQDYTSVALKFLKKAEEIETSLIPHARAYYLVEEGKTRKSLPALEQSIQLFDNFWEKEGIAESLLAMIPILPRYSVQRREALNRLYEINPGAFLQNNLGVPLEVRFYLSPGKKILERVLSRALKSSGSDIVTKNSAGNETSGFRYVLQIYWDNNDTPYFKLSDRKTETLILEEYVPLESGKGSGTGFPGQSIDVQAVTCIRDFLLHHLYHVDRY